MFGIYGLFRFCCGLFSGVWVIWALERFGLMGCLVGLKVRLGNEVMIRLINGLG